MWYRVARQLFRRNMVGGSFPTMGKSTNNQVATPTEADQLAQQATQARQPKPWGEWTMDARLQGMRDARGYPDVPAGIPDALLNIGNVQSAVMGNVPNDVARPHGDTNQAPRLRESFPTSSDPKQRLKFR